MKKLWLFLAAALLVLGLVGTSTAALYGGSEYQIVNSSGIGWTSAEAGAIALGAGWHLVTITSQGEQDFLAGILGTQDGLMWAGGYQEPNLAQAANGWHWVTAEAWSYTAWATAFATEPNDWPPNNELYLALDGRAIQGSASRNWTWNDGLTGEGILGYVAERTAVPEPSTLLLLGSGLLGLLGYDRRRMKK